MTSQIKAMSSFFNAFSKQKGFSGFMDRASSLTLSKGRSPFNRSTRTLALAANLSKIITLYLVGQSDKTIQLFHGLAAVNQVLPIAHTFPEGHLVIGHIQAYRRV